MAATGRQSVSRPAPCLPSSWWINSTQDSGLTSSCSPVKAVWLTSEQPAKGGRRGEARLCARGHDDDAALRRGCVGGGSSFAAQKALHGRRQGILQGSGGGQPLRTSQPTSFGVGGGAVQGMPHSRLHGWVRSTTGFKTACPVNWHFVVHVSYLKVPLLLSILLLRKRQDEVGALHIGNERVARHQIEAALRMQHTGGAVGCLLGRCCSVVRHT